MQNQESIKLISKQESQEIKNKFPLVDRILKQPGIRLGIPKKGLFKDTWRSLRENFIYDLRSEIPIVKDEDRRLSFSFGDFGGELMLDRQRDILEGLNRGVIDLAVIGEDEYWEARVGGMMLEQLDGTLGFGSCRMCLEVREGSSNKLQDIRASLITGKLVTGYPSLARCLHPN